MALITARKASIANQSTKNGLVLIARQRFTAVSTIQIDNIFNAQCKRHIIMFDCKRGETGLNYIHMRLRANGTTNTTLYDDVYQYNLSTGQAVNADKWREITYPTDEGVTFSRTEFSDIYEAENARGITQTVFNSFVNSASGNELIHFGYGLQNTTQYDGIEFVTNTGTITGGLTIYGWRY